MKLIISLPFFSIAAIVLCGCSLPESNASAQSAAVPPHTERTYDVTQHVDPETGQVFWTAGHAHPGSMPSDAIGPRLYPCQEATQHNINCLRMGAFPDQ